MLYFTPKVSKMDYCKIVMEKACDDYFDGDIVKFFQFLAKNNELTAEQKEEVLAALK